MNRWIFGSAALAMFLGGMGQARADLVTIFTNQAAFTAAAPPLTPVDFAGLVTNGSYEQGYPSGFTIQGEKFVPDSGYLYVRAPGALKSDASLYGPNGGFIGVDPASGTYAVGTSLSPFYGNLGTLTLDYTLSDATHSSFALTISSASGSFLGIVSDTPIANITYTDSNDYPIIDDFTVASTPAVPEPATLTLLGIGIAGMAGYGWRRRKLAVA